MSHRPCDICNKPIILSPSASERAEKYGGKPSDYLELFTSHSDCFIAKRNQETLELMKELSKPKTLLTFFQSL